MFIDMKQLFEVEGQVIPFTHDLDMSAIELWGTAPFDRPIRLSGRLYNRAGIVFMEYTAQMDYNLMCGRCLERQRRAEVYRFKHVLVRQLNEEDNGDFIVVSWSEFKSRISDGSNAEEDTGTGSSGNENTSDTAKKMRYVVQCGAFSERKNAEAMARQLQEKGFTAIVKTA